MFEKLKSLLFGDKIVAGATVSAASKPFTDSLIIEVLDGKWGSGDTRKKNLEAAGYDYYAVQKRVTEVVEHMKTRKEAMKPWFDACKAQQEWSYNARYDWGKWDKTIAGSKNYGTCITFPNVVAMRCGLIKEKYKYITSTGSNHDSKATCDNFYANSLKAMASINSKYWSSIKYPNKTTAQLVKEGKIKEGDIIGYMGHTTMYAGKDNKGNLLYNNAGHAAGIYDNNKAGSNRAVLNQKVNSYSNRLVYGVFSVNTFIVITSCINGKITYSDRYMAGQDVIITIEPNANHTIKSIKVDGKDISITNLYKINKIDSNHIIEVECKEIPKKTIDELAHEVLDGKWGAGEERKKKLEAAGYDYYAVQEKVNELLKKPYPGILPTTKLVKSNSEVINDACKWATWIAGDNRFHYGYTNKHGSSDSSKWNPNAHHNGCYFCGTNVTSGSRSKKGILDYERSYCCNPFVGAAWAHGGCVPKAMSLCQDGTSWDFHSGRGYDTSSLFTNLGKPAKSSLKKGDVCCSDSHVFLYLGDGKLAEATGGDDNVRNSKKWNNSIRVTSLTDSKYKSVKRVHRYNNSVDTEAYIRHGEVSNRVTLWQAFLDWYFDGQVGSADGYYGDNTLKWTKAFQEKEIGPGQGDGIIGNKTLEAAAKVIK